MLKYCPLKKCLCGHAVYTSPYPGVALKQFSCGRSGNCPECRGEVSSLDKKGGNNAESK